MKTVVILGHSGFIGSSLARHLRRAGWRVLGASSRECDLLKPAHIMSFFSKVSGNYQVILCSAHARINGRGPSNMKDNVVMVKHFIALNPAARCQGVIYLSSVDVYGLKPRLPITEKTALKPHNPYAKSKYAGEKLLRQANLKYPVTVLRLPGVYGPGDGLKSACGRLLTQLRAGASVQLSSNGTVKRDFLFIEDLCRFIELCLARPSRDVIKLASGQSFSLLQWLSWITSATKKTPRIELNVYPAGVGPLIFNNQHLRKRFPRFKFSSPETGLRIYLHKEATT